MGGKKLCDPETEVVHIFVHAGQTYSCTMSQTAEKYARKVDEDFCHRNIRFTISAIL